MSDAGMPPTKWVSDCKLIASTLNGISEHVNVNQATNVLGLLKWNSFDILCFEGIKLNSQIELAYCERSVVTLFFFIPLVSPVPVMFGFVVVF